MSLTEEAVAAISSYRTNTFRNPATIDKEQKKLQRTLTEIGRRDENIFYSVDNNTFTNLPPNTRFDREEYLCFRYLFESTYTIRKALVQEKRRQLESMAENLFNSNARLREEYKNKYERFNADSIAERLGLKAAASIERIKSSRNWFVIKKILEDAESYGIQAKDEWCEPSQYKKNIHCDFRTSSAEIAVAWGMSPRLIGYYINHIETKKTMEQVAVVSAIAGGAILAAYGLSRSSNSAQSSSASQPVFNPRMVSAPIAGAFSASPQNLMPLPGLENYSQYLSMPYNPVMANQGAFLHHLQNLGSSNAYDLQIAMLNNRTQQKIANMRMVSEALNPKVDYSGGIGNALSNSLGVPLDGSLGLLLGVPANLTISKIGDNATMISGSVRNHPVHATINNWDNMTTINSF